MAVSRGRHCVPCIIRYPVNIEANKTNYSFVSAIDLYPTLASVCDEDRPTEEAQKLDGVTYGKNQANSDSKAARIDGSTGTVWTGHRHPPGETGKPFFNYELSSCDLLPMEFLCITPEDPVEVNNLASKHPQKVEMLSNGPLQMLNEIYEDQLPLGYLEALEQSSNLPLKASGCLG